MNVAIRAYKPNDAAALFDIYTDAIRIGAAAHYTYAQRMAWAPNNTMPTKWPITLGTQQTWVAETDGDIAGFMSATHMGHIDLAFVRPIWMGRSVAQALYERILERAHVANLPRLTTYASHAARPFFARNNWQVDIPEQIDRNGEMLERFAMSLNLRDIK